MTRIILILIMVMAITACETTRESKTGNIGGKTSGDVGRNFDKTKAAQNRVNTGLTYLNQNNFERAKIHLDKALEYNPDSSDVQYALGIYYQRVNEFKKSRKHFNRALKLRPKNPQYLNAFGAFLCEQGEYKDADKMFGQAIDIPTYTDIAMAYFNIGFCALKQDKIDRAENYFRKALSRNRRMPDALIEMAKIEYSKERYERAMSYLKRFEGNARETSESAWLGLRTAHYLRDKDAIARYGLILEQRFPDSDETASYLDDRKKWM